MPANSAAWLTANKVTSLEVKTAPYVSPKGNQIVIRNHAVAINPVDRLIQHDGTAFMYTWLKFPAILGYDCAGEVVEVGPSVTRFKVGDRVVGMAAGTSEATNDPSQGAFQIYPILLEHMTSPIPSSMSYEQACVIPLGASTASCGLFQKDQLALQLPSSPPKPTGKTLPIWGGSTSVGINAIQLAVAAGYEVITTASPRNFSLVKKLGASQVFDYNSPKVIPDVIAAFKGKTTAGALSIGQGAAEACSEILASCTGNKFLSMISYPTPTNDPKILVGLRTAVFFMSWMATNAVKSKIRGIKHKFVFGDTLVGDGVGKAVFEDFLPGALAQGSFVAAPEPEVVGTGLEFIQEAFELQRKGVSAKKIVVSL
jgi:NADPH:quinone reductase-like Zn-dependent oxidoreductase